MPFKYGKSSTVKFKIDQRLEKNTPSLTYHIIIDELLSSHLDPLRPGGQIHL